MPRPMSILPRAVHDTRSDIDAESDDLIASGDHGLPAPLTSFVGREKEIAELCALLNEQGVRLLTLTGSPGIGKTRLALQVAERMATAFPDGVHFISLAAVTVPDLVVGAITQALGLRVATGEPVQNRLQSYLRNRRTLLVLDNFEQVTPAGQAIAEMLAFAPLAKVLVTSRALLQVYGEHEFRVPPLALPNVSQWSNLRALARSEAVSLFIQRARAIRPDLKLANSNAAAIAELCSRLEGIPLAIELAAGRTKLISLHAMLARLESRLDFLKGGAGNLPLRQRTLRDAIEWSYELLDASQQRLLRTLAVFSGGFTSEAAHSLCSGEERCAALEGDQIERNIEALLNQSLLSQTDGEEARRFLMLETVREYALERLVASGQENSARGRHALLLAQVAEQARDRLSGPFREVELDHLEREYENLRAALTWCALPTGEGATGLRIATALIPFWQLHGPLSEGRKWLSLFLGHLDMSSASQQELEALLSLGQFVSNQDDHAEARTIFEQTLVISKRLSYAYGVGISLAALGHQAIHLGEPDHAREYYSECLALCVKADDKRNYANILLCLGDLACHKEEYTRAMELFGEALNLARECGAMPGIIAGLTRLAYLHAHRGDSGRALPLATEALGLLQQGANRGGIAYCLGLHGKIAYVAGDAGRAATIFGAASAQCEALGIRMEPMLHTDPDEYEKLVVSLREILGTQAFDVAWQRGRMLTVPEAVNLIMKQEPAGRQAARTGRDRTDVLTRREIEVLKLVTNGLTNAQVADRLIISPFTVNMHLRSIYSKLGVTSRSAATRFAVEKRLVTTDH